MGWRIAAGGGQPGQSGSIRAVCADYLFHANILRKRARCQILSAQFAQIVNRVLSIHDPRFTIHDPLFNRVEFSSCEGCAVADT
jgi:hypothetical protein